MSSVLITGASRGIGRATALDLARRGHRVIATARRPEVLDDLPVDLRLPLDVTDQRSVEQAVAAAGEIDALVSNAGETLRAPVESVSLDEVDRLFQLNTLGALRVAQAVLPAMRKRGSGRVLFVSSILGRLAIPLIGAYAASKWALEALAETLAIEVGHFGVTVSLLQPGSVNSGGAERALTLVPDGSPYRPLLDQMAAARGSAITVEEAAMLIADAVEQPHPPLRIPVGAPAATVLAARKAAPEEVPFETSRLDW